MKTTTVKLSGLTCTACTKLITKRIKTISDIEDVNVELPGTATIKANRDISEDEVKKVLEGTHYTVVGKN
jgi:copper chaperone CopZ